LHDTHTEDPATEKEPGIHELHDVDEFDPSILEAVPAGQLIHAIRD
jgi:hypothetical protein